MLKDKANLSALGTAARTSLLSLSLLACLGTASGQELQFRPAQHEKGPLLFFVHPEDSDGRPCGGPDRMEILYVLDPTHPGPPQVLWRGGNPRPRPLARLDDDLVLIEYEDRTYLLELSKGKTTSVLPTTRQTKAVAVVGTNVYFVERLVPRHMGGLKLGSGEQGQTAVVSYHRARDRVHVLDAGAARTVRRCGGTEVERVLGVDAGTIWAVSAGQQRHLVRIDSDGKSEEIVPFDSQWVLPMTQYAFSPNKRYLAFGLLHAKHDFHKERELVVVDLLRKKKAFVRERVPVRTGDKHGSAAPRLTLGWLNNTRLAVYGGPSAMLLVDVENGRLLDSTYSPDPVVDSPVQRPDLLDVKSKFVLNETRGCFERKLGLFYYKGGNTPVASVWDRDRAVWVQDLVIDQKGEWASFSRDDSTYLINGRKKQKSRLLRGWSYDLVWLPAVESR